MFQCTDCNKTFERQVDLINHNDKEHPDDTLASHDDTTKRGLDVENTFMAQEALNQDCLEFAGEVGSQNDFTQLYCLESVPEYSDDLGLEANSVSMRIHQLGEQLDKVQDGILDASIVDNLDDSLTLVSSTQADPASRQLFDGPPSANMKELQSQLTGHLNDSPSLRQLNPPSPTNPFSHIQMKLLVPTPARETTRTQEDKFEKCTVCSQTCRDVHTLQKHILSYHCGQSPELLRSLTVMQQQLITVLANQSAQEKKVNTIESNINSLSSNMLVVKEAIYKNGDSTRSFPLAGSSRAPSWAERTGGGARPENRSGAPVTDNSTKPSDPLAGRNVTHQANIPPSSPQDSTWAVRAREPPTHLANPSPSSPQDPTLSERARGYHGPQNTGSPPAQDKMLLVTDSIGHNMHINEIEELTNMKIFTKKAYCAMPGGIFPNSDFSKVVPEMLRSHPDAKVLTFNASASDLTNISPGATEEYLKQQASSSSFSTLQIASNALQSRHPNLAKIVIPERTARYDNLSRLNEYANKELYKARDSLPANIRERIVIGQHKVHCQGALRVSRFGVDGTRVEGKKVDGLHMRGSSGKIAFTRSFAGIMAQAGLASAAQVEQFGKNRKIKMTRKNNQGLVRHQEAAPRLDAQRGLEGDQASTPRLVVQEYNVQTNNMWSALEQENC